jgi:hypothetical protein
MFIPYLGTTGIAEGTGSALLEQAIQHAAAEGKGLGGGPTSAALPFWRKHGWVSDPADEGWDFWGWTPEQVADLAHGILTAHPSESAGSQPSVPDSANVPALPSLSSPEPDLGEGRLDSGEPARFTGPMTTDALPEATDNGGPWTVVHRKNPYGRFQKTGSGGTWQEAVDHAHLYPADHQVYYVHKDDDHVITENNRKVTIEPTKAEKQAKREENARVKAAADEMLRPDAFGPSYLERLLIGDARVILGIEAPSVRAAAEALARAGWTRRSLGQRHS